MSTPLSTRGDIFVVPDTPQHDPEKWVPVFPRDKREAFARRSCSRSPSLRAKRSNPEAKKEDWIASSQELLAMT